MRTILLEVAVSLGKCPPTHALWQWPRLFLFNPKTCRLIIGRYGLHIYISLFAFICSVPNICQCNEWENQETGKMIIVASPSRLRFRKSHWNAIMYSAYLTVVLKNWMVVKCCSFYACWYTQDITFLLGY